MSNLREIQSAGERYDSCRPKCTHTEENAAALEILSKECRLLDIETDGSLPVLCSGYLMPRTWSEVSEEMPCIRAE